MVSSFLEKTKYYSVLIARPPAPTKYSIKKEDLDSVEFGKDQTDSAILRPAGVWN